MATKATTHPTLLDLANASDPDGKIAVITEILNETNEVLDDMVVLEGNLPTGNKTTVRSGLPEPTWRKLYGGVQPTKANSVPVTDTTGMLEAYAEVDKELADLNGNTAAFRLSEDRAHIEGISQEIANTLFYGDEDLYPERFTGLGPRYNDLSAENAKNIIDAKGTGSDNASIWLVVWGPNTCYGIVPKGSKAGLVHEDKGQVTIENVDGLNGRMEAYRSHYQQKLGLTVRDWRYVVRICNIDKSLLTTDVSTGANLPELMFEASEIIPNLASGRAAWYMSRTLRTKARQQAANGTSSSTLAIENVGGKRLITMHDIPMKRVDALAADEARIV